MHIVKEKKVEWGKAISNIIQALKMPQVRPLYITNFLFQGGFSFYITFMAVYLLTKFNFSQGELGNYFAFVGIWIVITQGLITRKVAQYMSEAKVVQNSLIAVGLCILLIVMVPSTILLYAVVPFFAIAVGLSQANITALISRSANAGVQGEVLGINGSVMALAQAIPPILSGLVAGLLEPQAPLLIASLLTVIAGMYFNNHLRVLKLSHS